MAAYSVAVYFTEFNIMFDMKLLIVNPNKNKCFLGTKLI